MKENYDSFIASQDPDSFADTLGFTKEMAPRFDVTLGDIFDVDWSSADFIFCNSTCFT